MTKFYTHQLVNVEERFEKYAYKTLLGTKIPSTAFGMDDLKRKLQDEMDTISNPVTLNTGLKPTVDVFYFKANGSIDIKVSWGIKL